MTYTDDEEGRRERFEDDARDVEDFLQTVNENTCFGDVDGSGRAVFFITADALHALALEVTKPGRSRRKDS